VTLWSVESEYGQRLPNHPLGAWQSVKLTYVRGMKAKRFKSVLLCAAALQAVVGGGQPVTKIAGGLHYGLFLKSDGSILDVGCEANGEWGCNPFKRSN
jgi:hypothetical protein